MHSDGSCAQAGSRLGLSVLIVAVPAACIAFLYSWDPYSLKGHGLGEVTVFVMFGPLLVIGVNVAVNGAIIDWLSVAYSVPLGLLTAAVLFANNLRDVEADRNAGKTTLSIMLGRDASELLFRRLLASAYVSVFCLVVVLGTSPHQVLILGCVPWSIYLVRRVEIKAYYELPQSVAQHNLLWGVLLTATLSEPMFVIRILIACLYALGGINNIVMWQYNRFLVHQKLSNVWPSISLVVSDVCFTAAAVGQLVTSVAFMLGIYPVVMAKLLLVFIIPVTFLVHDMWTIEDDHPTHLIPSKGTKRAASRSVANFPTEFDNEFVHFFKNVGMIGALYLYIAAYEHNGT